MMSSQSSSLRKVSERDAGQREGDGLLSKGVGEEPDDDGEVPALVVGRENDRVFVIQRGGRAEVQRDGGHAWT